MGGRNPDRLALVGMLKLGRPNHVWVAKCLQCGRKAPLPTEQILKRVPERTPIVVAARKLRCGGCRRVGAEIYLAELP